MSKRILLGTCEIPGWGGAATCHYELFERMQRDGINVVGLNLFTKMEEVFFRYVWGDRFANPRGLADFHSCVVEDRPEEPDEPLARLIESLAPDLLVSFGVITTLRLRRAAPHLPLVLFTIGSYHAQRLIETGAVRDFMAFRRLAERGVRFSGARHSPEGHSPEGRAVSAADLIVVHSPLVRYAVEHFFPQRAGKIYAHDISIADLVYPEAERFATLRRPFPERDIDLIFVASSWNRPVKNFALVERIVAQCDGLTIHVVGDIDRPRLRGRFHGVVTRREELYGLLGRSKTIVCPSLVDAAPGVLFEASAMGCNVIASPNCGNWALCHAELLADRCVADRFLDCIRRSLSGPLTDNRAHFRGGYADLVDTLTALL